MYVGAHDLPTDSARGHKPQVAGRLGLSVFCYDVGCALTDTKYIAVLRHNWCL